MSCASVRPCAANPSSNVSGQSEAELLKGVQVAGVEAAGREHDPILYDLGSEAQTRIDVRQAGENLLVKQTSCPAAVDSVTLFPVKLSFKCATLTTWHQNY